MIDYETYMFRTSAMDYFPPHLITCHLNFALCAESVICDHVIARGKYISILNTQRLQNNSLVLSVKFVEANKGYGN